MRQYVTFRKQDGTITAVLRVSVDDNKHHPGETHDVGWVEVPLDHPVVDDPESFIVQNGTAFVARTPTQVCARAREIHERTKSGELKKGSYLERHKMLFTNEEWEAIDQATDLEERVKKLEGAVNALVNTLS